MFLVGVFFFSWLLYQVLVTSRLPAKAVTCTRCLHQERSVSASVRFVLPFSCLHRFEACSWCLHSSTIDFCLLSANLFIGRDISARKLGPSFGIHPSFLNIVALIILIMAIVDAFWISGLHVMLNSCVYGPSPTKRLICFVLQSGFAS